MGQAHFGGIPEEFRLDGRKNHRAPRPVLVLKGEVEVAVVLDNLGIFHFSVNDRTPGGALSQGGHSKGDMGAGFLPDKGHQIGSQGFWAVEKDRNRIASDLSAEAF